MFSHKRTWRPDGGFLFVAVMLLAVPATAGEYWPSFRGDAALTGTSAATPPAELNELWSLPAPDGIEATAAIVGTARSGEVYAATLGGRLLRLDAATGDIVWEYKTDADGDGPNAFRPGFKSSPAVAVFSGVIVVGDEDGFVHGVNRTDGSRRWVFETGAEIISSATVVVTNTDPPKQVPDETVLIGSYDNTLYAIDARRGGEVWRLETDGYVHCTPAVAADPGVPSGRVTFVAGCDETLRVVDVGTGAERLAMPLGSYLISSPAVAGEFLYLGTYQGETVAVNWKKGEIAWRAKPEAGRDLPIHSSAAVTDDAVVIGGRDKLIRRHDRATGEVLWATPARGRVDSSPVIAGGTVYVGSADRRLYAIDLATGEKKSTTDLGRAVVASPAVAEGLLVIGTTGSNGKLFAFGE